MKLWCYILIYLIIIVAMKTEEFDTLTEFSLKKRNILVNVVTNKLIVYIRHIITQGSYIFGIPILDPFERTDFHLIVPTGLFTLDLQFKNISVIGIGGFVLHKSILHLSNLTFEMDVSLPRMVISAESMDIFEINKDIISHIPMYKRDKTELEMDNFRLQASFQLKQSDDEKSVLIEKVEKAFIDMPSFKINSNRTIDRENSEMFPDLEHGLLKYVKSREHVIMQFITNAILTFGNPILNRLNTWRYIEVLL